MRSFRRWQAVWVVGCCLAAAPARAGTLDVAPSFETAAGYDGNFFLDEAAAARVQAYPLRAGAALATTWVPGLRASLRAHGGYALQRLWAQSPLGTLGVVDGGVESVVRPTFFSFVNLDGWAAQNRTSGGDAITFLDGDERGGRLAAGYRFAWATLGAEASATRVDYARQPVTTGVERSDTFAAAGITAAFAAAGQWRPSLSAGRNASTYHAAAYRTLALGVDYAHALWSGADGSLDTGWRAKTYELAGRRDGRWHLGAALSQRVNEWLGVRAALRHSLNRSNTAGNDYDWTTFECVVSVQPHWSFLY
jgi:hypothetical protein